MGADMKETAPGALLGSTAIRPKEKTAAQAFKDTIYNKETGEFFTRTPKSWFLITLFYCIYYTCLAGFWYGMLVLLMNMQPQDTPMWQLDESIIGSNPGLGMRPSQPDVTIDSSMLKLKYDAWDERPSSDFESSSNMDWAERYRMFLTRYDDTEQTEECSAGNVPKSVENGAAACRFPLDVLGECGVFPYGYQLADGQEEDPAAQVQPCVLLKMNRIINWKPEPFTNGELRDALKDKEAPMPQRVHDMIRADPNKVYIDCDGENPADMEALRTGGSLNLKYFPEDQGIPMYFLPYQNRNVNYHSPLVAVKIGSGVPKGQLIHVMCKLWAKGVVHNTKDRVGIVRFELLLDENN